MIQTQQPTTAVAQNTVSLNLNEANLPLIMDFLVQQQIPFELKYALKSIELISKTMPAQTIASESPDPVNGKKIDNLEDRMDDIYQTYIVGKTAQTPPKIQQIAKEAGMNVAKFRTCFEARYGDSFYQVYINHKMKHAALLLKKGHKCNDVSKQVGYSATSAIKFNKMFQKHFGTTPKKYQMSQKQ